LSAIQSSYWICFFRSAAFNRSYLANTSWLNKKNVLNSNDSEARERGEKILGILGIKYCINYETNFFSPRINGFSWWKNSPTSIQNVQVKFWIKIPEKNIDIYIMNLRWLAVYNGWKIYRRYIYIYPETNKIWILWNILKSLLLTLWQY